MDNILQKISQFSKQQSVTDSKLVRFTFLFPPQDLENEFESLIDNCKCLFYFSKPTEKFKFLGIGSIDNPHSEEIIEKVSKGEADSNYLIDAYKEIQVPGNIPLVLGAEKFPVKKNDSIWNDFDESNWFIPQILLYQDSENSYLILQYMGNNPSTQFFEETLKLLVNPELKSHHQNPCVQSSNTTNINDWTTAVNRALNQIRNKIIEKVVLARKIEFSLDMNLSISRALLKLQKRYPDCSTFAFRKKGSTFFGSTPEKLFSLIEKKLETEALAGSIARGANLDDDITKENILLNNEKEISEHKNVLSFLIDNLEILTKNLSYSPIPQIKKLSNIQHLQTQIKANLNDEVEIWEIQEKLHPTPAVCGLPQKKALELIKDLEYFERGLYTGIIGWFNEKRRAEFVVGLRCALLKDNTLTAFAGCGIVEGSDPISEFNETELKFKPILTLLENEIIS